MHMYMFRHWANGENHLNTITVQTVHTERDLPELPHTPLPHMRTQRASSP